MSLPLLDVGIFVYIVHAVITSVSSYVCDPCYVGRMLFI